MVRTAPKGLVYHNKYMIIDDEFMYVSTGNLVDTDYPRNDIIPPSLPTNRNMIVVFTGYYNAEAMRTVFDSDYAAGNNVNY